MNVDYLSRQQSASLLLLKTKFILKNTSVTIPPKSNAIPRHTSKVNESIFHTKICTIIFTEALFLMAPNWEQLNGHQLVNGNKSGISIWQGTFQQEKGMKFWYMQQRGWSSKTVMPEVKKSKHKRLYIVRFHLYDMSRGRQIIETESRLVVTWV